MSQLPFSHPVRVYWEDTDAGGVVYHASYVCFLERARSEWLRHLGVSQDALRADADLVFAVRAMRLDFLKPARLDDLLHVMIDRLDLRPASLRFGQRIVRVADGVTLLEAEVRCACLSAASFRPRPMPEALAATVLSTTSTAPLPE